MLEFFSLYRGYGLSLAFLSGFIYYFSRHYSDSKGIGFLIKGVLFSILAIYANFALLIPVFVVQLLYFIFLNKEIKISLIIKRKETLVFIVGGILLIPAVSNILILSNLNELYFGGDTSFVNDTLNSVIGYTFYSKNETDKIIIHILFVLMVGCGLFFNRNKNLFFITVVLLGVAILPTILNTLLDTKFVIERASLYLIPFIAIFIMVLYDSCSNQKQVKTILSIMILFLSISAVKHSIKSYNLNTTTTWKTDANNKDVLTDIINNNKFTLGVFWIFEDATKYYAQLYRVEKLQSIKRLGSNKPINPGLDYYYIRNSDLKRVTFDYKVLKEYPLSGTVILKKK